jgi:hypothetical protein
MTLLTLSFLISPLLSGDAYLDPGSGSVILQVLLASLFAVLFFFRASIRKLFDRLRKKSNSEEQDEEQE